MTTGQFSGDARIMPTFNFIWEDRSRLHLAAFQSFNPDAPWHVILDYSGSDYRILHGYGERFEPLAPLGRGSRAFAAFEMIEGRVWTGSPFSSHLNVYDGEGRHLATLNPVARINGARHEDFDGIRAEDLGSLRGKVRNGHILRVHDLVCVRIGNTYDVYDTNGNLIRGKLDKGLFHPPMDWFSEGDDHFVVSRLLPTAQTEFYDPDDYEMLLGAGFDVAHLEETNPYLRIGRLHVD
jgi:hypothetical protein